MKFLFIIFFSIFFSACSDKGSPYYVVDKVRTPVAQVYSQTVKTSGQGCISALFDSNTWCQQFPIRPSGALNSGPVKLRFVTLAPAGNTVTLTLTHLKIFDMKLVNGSAGDGARGIDPSTPATEIPLSDLAFTLNNNLSKTIQTTPMQVQTFVFDFTPPSLNALITYAQNNQFLPGFVLFYTATSPGLGYVDHGYYTFYFLPDPTDTTSLTTLATSVSGFVSQSVLAQAYSLSNLNEPIQIESISAADGTVISAGSDNNISAQLTFNPNPKSFSPVQWYVSSGSVDNDRASSTKWNPKQGGNVSSFFVVRDLLGGIDARLNNYTAQ